MVLIDFCNKRNLGATSESLVAVNSKTNGRRKNEDRRKNSRSFIVKECSQWLWRGCPGRFYGARWESRKRTGERTPAGRGNAWQQIIAGMDEVRAANWGDAWDRGADTASGVTGGSVGGTVAWLCQCSYFLSEIRSTGVSKGGRQGLDIRALR